LPDRVGKLFEFTLQTPGLDSRISTWLRNTVEPCSQGKASLQHLLKSGLNGSGAWSATERYHQNMGRAKKAAIKKYTVRARVPAKALICSTGYRFARALKCS
jgi:hypothetical protein